MVWSIFQLVLALLLVVGTYFLTRPEVAMLAGRGDHRPWLVRLREHGWREINLLGITAPRSLAYALLVIGWLLLLR